MMERILGDIKSAGYPEVVLWVFDNNARAIGFYEALGFTRFQALRHDGTVEDFGLDLERLASEPARRGLTHVDLHITR